MKFRRPINTPGIAPFLLEKKKSADPPPDTKTEDNPFQNLPRLGEVDAGGNGKHRSTPNASGATTLLSAAFLAGLIVAKSTELALRLIPGKRANERTRALASQLAVEAGWIAQATDADGLHFNGFTLNCRDSVVQDQLFSKICSYINALPPNSSTWRRHIDSYFNAAESIEDIEQKKGELSALLVVTACVKVDRLCSLAFEFHRDHKLRKITMIAFYNLCVAITALLPGTSRYGMLHPVSTTKLGVVEIPSKRADQIFELLPMLSKYASGIFQISS